MSTATVCGKALLRYTAVALTRPAFDMFTAWRSFNKMVEKCLTPETLSLTGPTPDQLGNF